MFSLKHVRQIRNRRFSQVGLDKPPKKARVVVIGGGIIGSSTAYHLAKAGWGSGDNGTIVLEQSKLTSGTTWHAAGFSSDEFS
mgnify:CR=1 FL=1